jgi:hypothetical protein
MWRFNKDKKIFLFLLAFLLLGLVSKVLAAVDCSKILDQRKCENTQECDWDTVSGKCCDTTEVKWPNSPLGTSIARCTNVTGMVKYFYEWGIALGGLAAFISLVIGGFQYLTSMGEPARLAEAKDRIRSAFFGLILLLGSWLILNTINPQLTTFKAKLELVTVKPEEWRLGTPELKPCEFAVLYDQVDWKGNTKIIKPEEGTVSLGGLAGGLPLIGGAGRFNLQSYIIYKPREITTIECDPSQPVPTTTICVKNEEPWREKNCKKKYCLLEPCDPETEHCLDTQEGKHYKAGGACVLEAYYESSWWIFKTGGCGDKMASIGAPAVSDISVHLQNPLEVKCVRLVQIKTKK